MKAQSQTVQRALSLFFFCPDCGLWIYTYILMPSFKLLGIYCGSSMQHATSACDGSMRRQHAALATFGQHATAACTSACGGSMRRQRAQHHVAAACATRCRKLQHISMRRQHATAACDGSMHISMRRKHAAAACAATCGSSVRAQKTDMLELLSLHPKHRIP
jgi:hypothetical protein